MFPARVVDIWNYKNVKELGRSLERRRHRYQNRLHVDFKQTVCEVVDRIQWLGHGPAVGGTYLTR